MPPNVKLPMPLHPNTTKQPKYPTNIPYTFKIHMEQPSLLLEYGHVTEEHNSPEERGSLGGSGFAALFTSNFIPRIVR